LLAEWFTKSLIGPIARDVSMGSVITKEQAIRRDRYLDLVYSQTGMLYDLIHDAPHPSTNPTPMPPVASHATDGVIDTFHAETQSKQASHSNPKSTTTNVQNVTPPTFPGKTSEVNTIQSTPTSKNKNKKKGKGENKEDKNNNQQSDKPKTQLVDDKEKRKPCYPCLICGEDHYMKDCPRHAEVNKFL
jgi:hypothetical protein